MSRIKGYFVPDGYMGWVEWLDRYMLFASESDYLEYVTDVEQN